ncbi:MAG: ABC transporter ATP-binding protein [Firmicutes bacterium]|nr:ABC transporter ATP-binding protein [Bacillota bacterium]
MIEIEGLTKSFGSHIAVKDVSFDVRPGEVVGLLGPNGAGKTTTLRMLSTTLRPTSGTARIAGYDVVREPDKVRASIGVLPTDPGLYGRLTAEENLRFFGRLAGLSGAELERRIDRLLKWLGMDEHRKRRTEGFSKGMRQKIALARSILHEPPVLILDEPTAGLDVSAARTIIDFIQESKAAGRTVLFSSHYLVEAERVCDRIAIIADGRIRATGTPEEICREAGADTLEDAFLTLVYGEQTKPEVSLWAGVR